MKCLLSVEPGASVRIVDILGGEAVRKRLFSLGLHAGDRIRIEARGIFKGPLLVRHEASGVAVAIGRGIAQKIMVEA